MVTYPTLPSPQSPGSVDPYTLPAGAYETRFHLHLMSQQPQMYKLSQVGMTANLLTLNIDTYTQVPRCASMPEHVLIQRPFTMAN